MNIGFEVIQDSIAIIRTKSVYKQSKVYLRKKLFFVKTCGGFVRLNLNGSTSHPGVTWLEIEVDSSKAFAPKPMKSGNLEMKHAAK